MASIHDGQTAESKPSAGVVLPEPDAPREPCPTPLAWTDIRQSFLTEAERFAVERPGGSICGRAWGQGSPVYFLNGLCGDCELFCLLAWLLREDFRCVLFDDGAIDGTADETANAISAVADFFQHDRFSLFAASVGRDCRVVGTARSARTNRPSRVAGELRAAPVVGGGTVVERGAQADSRPSRLAARLFENSAGKSPTLVSSVRFVAVGILCSQRWRDAIARGIATSVRRCPVRRAAVAGFDSDTRTHCAERRRRAAVVGMSRTNWNRVCRTLKPNGCTQPGTSRI